MRGNHRDIGNLRTFANKLFLMHMQSRGGLGDELPAAQAVKNRLIEEFAAYVRDGDELATPREFCRIFFLELKTISPPVAALVKQFDEAEGGDVPFAKRFADGVDANQQFEFDGKVAP